MKELKIALPENVLDQYRYEANVLGMTPNAVIRLRLCERVLGFNLDMSQKSYIVQFDKWQEVEAYAEAKGLRLDKFIADSVKSVMRRNRLKPAQKAQFNQIAGK